MTAHVCPSIFTTGIGRERAVALATLARGVIAAFRRRVWGAEATAMRNLSIMVNDKRIAVPILSPVTTPIAAVRWPPSVLFNGVSLTQMVSSVV